MGMRASTEEEEFVLLSHKSVAAVLLLSLASSLSLLSLLLLLLLWDQFSRLSPDTLSSLCCCDETFLCCCSGPLSTSLLLSDPIGFCVFIRESNHFWQQNAKMIDNVQSCSAYKKRPACLWVSAHRWMLNINLSKLTPPPNNESHSHPLLGASGGNLVIDTARKIQLLDRVNYRIPRRRK